MSVKPFTINKQQAAYLLDTTERSMTTWQQRAEDPLPIARAGRRGQRSEYDPQELLRWALRRRLAELDVTEDGEVIDYDTERARLTKAQADHEELKVSAMRGDMLPAEVVITLCQSLVGAARARLLGVHAKVRSRYPDVSDDVVEEIEALVREALAELGNDGLPTELRERLAAYIDDVESAAEADAEPVG